MDSGEVKAYFEKPEVVADYLKAAQDVGLWESERIVFGGVMNPKGALLELGCGAGRIAFGLERLGFCNIVAGDISSAMVKAAAGLAAKNGSGVRFETLDARRLRFGDGEFDSVVFGFNGLMQIPLRKNRRKAMGEVFRVLKPGGVFAFTTHDRDAEKNRDYWQMEARRWAHGVQYKKLDEFGDIVYDSYAGSVYIHSPLMEEVRADISAAGFEISFCRKRSQIAAENDAVLEFSDECVFWVANKPQL